MKTFGKMLMTLGAIVGLAVAIAMLAHLGVAGPWLVNVALAKLAIVASLGLMGGGAVALRIGKRDASAQLLSGHEPGAG